MSASGVPRNRCRCCAARPNSATAPLRRQVVGMQTPGLGQDRGHGARARHTLRGHQPAHRRYLGQTATIGGAEANGDPGAHAIDSHEARSVGIPSGLFRQVLSTSGANLTLGARA
jgi:hypothetical protein